MVFSETVSSAVKAYKGIQVTSKKMIEFSTTEEVS